MVVEDGGVGADLGGHVADLGVEPIADRRVVERGARYVLAERGGEQLRVALAIERVFAVVQAGARDRLHLVEEREDVERLVVAHGWRPAIQSATTRASSAPLSSCRKCPPPSIVVCG